MNFRPNAERLMEMGSTTDTSTPFVDVDMACAYAFPRLPAPIIKRRGGEAENGGREGAGRRVIFS